MLVALFAFCVTATAQITTPGPKRQNGLETVPGGYIVELESMESVSSLVSSISLIVELDRGLIDHSQEFKNGRFLF